MHARRSVKTVWCEQCQCVSKIKESHLNKDYIQSVLDFIPSRCLPKKCIKKTSLCAVIIFHEFLIFFCITFKYFFNMRDQKKIVLKQSLNEIHSFAPSFNL